MKAVGEKMVREVQSMSKKNYDRDYPPIDCDCGCEETEVRNEVYEDGYRLVEYSLYCKCGKYLGHFAYGHWEF